MILHNYCSFASKFFTNEEVDLIHTEASKLPLDKGRVGQQEDDLDGPNENHNVNTSIRRSDIKWFSEESPMNPTIVNKIHDGVGMLAQQSGWDTWEYDYLEPLQYTIYRHREDEPKGDFYTWHTDSVPNQYGDSMRKLSFSIQLSHPDDYEGGQFEYMDSASTFDRLKLNQKTISVDDIVKSLPFSAKEKGSLIVFPSFVHHQVKPVTRGTRVSLVGWLVGKVYK